MAGGKKRKEGQMVEGLGFLSFADNPDDPKYQAEIAEFSADIGEFEAQRWLDQMAGWGADDAPFIAGALRGIWLRLVDAAGDQADAMLREMVAEAGQRGPDQT